MSKAGYIPDDFVKNILLRLPSNSVLRFKTVSKSWYSLISNPEFINLHNKQASQNPKILFTTKSMQFRLLDSESSYFDESCLTAHSLNIPIETDGCSRNNYLRILGSSCSILCVAIGPITYKRNCRGIHYPGHGRNSSTHLFVVNPFTREFRKIPDLTPPVSHWDEFVVHGHGFGYNPITNDLKLVMSDPDYYVRKYNVFSMKSNSWKSVECPFKLEGDNEATVIDGVFYWLKGPYPYQIIAFDSIEDEFRGVQVPKVMSSRFSSACLVEHKGCVCISLSTFVPAKVEIWMLKEDDWVHLLNISSNTLSRFGSYFEAIFISRGTQVILHNGKHIVRYSEEEEKVDGFSATICESITFVDTLVSPNQIEIIDN